MTNHETIIAEWIAAANAHDTAGFLSFFTPDGKLDDPSVGEVFEGVEGIARYFESYFIGYDTTTRVLGITPEATFTHVDVDFTGTFPGGQTGGIFDITFEGDLIALVRADLS